MYKLLHNIFTYNSHTNSLEEIISYLLQFFVLSLFSQSQFFYNFEFCVKSMWKMFDHSNNMLNCVFQFQKQMSSNKTFIREQR